MDAIKRTLVDHPYLTRYELEAVLARGNEADYLSPVISNEGELGAVVTLINTAGSILRVQIFRSGGATFESLKTEKAEPGFPAQKILGQIDAGIQLIKQESF